MLWSLVMGDIVNAATRRLLADRLGERRRSFLAKARSEGRLVDIETQRTWAASEVQKVVTDAAIAEEISVDAAQLKDLHRQILDSAFAGARLLRAYETVPEALNMTVSGTQPVIYEMPDGSTRVGDPVADSDDELYHQVREMASMRGIEEKQWDPLNPELGLTLRDGGRLTAVRWVTETGTFVTIRRHTLATVTLGDLVGNGTITPKMLTFLRAAVASGARILIAGTMNSGKTTMMRAMAAELRGGARNIVTVESEAELLLHRHPEVYGQNVHAMTARRANSEAKGAISLEALIVIAQRMSPWWMLIGEIRGPEVTAAMTGLQQGYPVMSTIHGHDPIGAITTLAHYYQRFGDNVSWEASIALCAANIDVVVHVGIDHDGRRAVKGIAWIVGIAEDRRTVAAELMWRPEGSGPGKWQHTAKLPPEAAQRLASYGFNPLLGDHDAAMLNGRLR